MAKASSDCKSCGATHIIESSIKDIASHSRDCYKCGTPIIFKVKATIEESSEVKEVSGDTEVKSNPAPQKRGRKSKGGKK